MVTVPEKLAGNPAPEKTNALELLAGGFLTLKAAPAPCAAAAYSSGEVVLKPVYS